MLTVALLILAFGSKDYPQLIKNVKLVSKHTACIVKTAHRCKK